MAETDILLTIGGAITYLIGMVNYGSRTSIGWFYLAFVGFVVMAVGIMVMVS